MSLSSPQAPAAGPEPAETDAHRVGTYALLARLVGPQPPDAATLEALRRAVPANPEHDAISRAWADLAGLAGEAEEQALARVHHDLLVGVVHGAVIPHAAWYRQGALMGRTLANLRGDLQRLGLRRDPHSAEPEDHLGLLCEAMAWLIQDGAQPFSEERAFFQGYLQPWVVPFFDDMAGADSADAFYRAVAALGTAFFQVETQYYAMRR